MKSVLDYRVDLEHELRDRLSLTIGPKAHRILEQHIEKIIRETRQEFGWGEKNLKAALSAKIEPGARHA